MEVVIFTLFPETIEAYLKIGMFQRAIAKKFASMKVVNLRDFAMDAHKSARPTERRQSFGRVDDRPYGGGAGMVLRVDVIDRALKKHKFKKGTKNSEIVLMTPQGKVFNQTLAIKLGKFKRIALICGRYEGFDERVYKLVDTEISLGDFVMTGGEIAALAIMDTVVRLVPGVVGKSESLLEESFADGMIEYPHYTRPENYKGWKVPKVLLTGHHGNISDWRKEQSLKRTQKKRPDLLK
jgi:tRNA (guanine37-N1)-methyltransferase